MIDIVKDRIYGDGVKERVLDLYVPEGEPNKVLLFVHGGGLNSGDKCENFSREIGTSLAEEGVLFVSANYRLYPKAAFPDYVEDVAAAIRYVKKNLAERKELYIWGQSAGAYIALMLIFDESYLANAGIKKDEICGWFVESAQPTTHFNVLQERGEDARLVRVDTAAPIYWVNENSGFSKMELIAYSDDIPCRYEQNLLLYKTILQMNPKADMSFLTLPGTHCEASTRKSGDGYPIVEHLKRFIGVN